MKTKAETMKKKAEIKPFVQMTTRKKVKVVGTKNYIDAETGEIYSMNVVTVEERDCNFHKLWLGHIIESLDLIGNQKISLCLWIMEHLDRENRLIYTYRRMEKATGISYKTIAETMKVLMDSNFLTQIQSGVYQVNPNVIFKGGKNDRLNVLIQYNEAREPAIDFTEAAEKKRKTKIKKEATDENK